MKPGVVATAILSFVFSWNNFLFSVILAGRTTRTLPIAVYNMISYEEINWGTLAAAATLITLPSSSSPSSPNATSSPASPSAPSSSNRTVLRCPLTVSPGVGPEVPWDA